MVGVVDDDISVRKGLSRLLRSAGYDVVTFASGEECLAGIASAEFGCLVVDVHLGGMNGFELLQKLRASTMPVPVVFITAHDESVTREALRAAGSPPCLRKPFDANSLLTVIQSTLHSV
jgi:FixJ family two-component response regulator